MITPREPKWRDLRIQVFERDDWTCQQCGDKHVTLNVHTTRFVEGVELGDYDAGDMVTLCEYCHEEAHHKAKTLLQPKKPRKVGYSYEFNTWYQQYPRKVGKGAAYKAWLLMKEPKPPLSEMLRTLEWQKKLWTDPQYTPHPSTYLNARRWEDEPETRRKEGPDTSWARY